MVKSPETCKLAMLMETLMGSDPDHLVEALEEVFGSQSTEEQDTQEEETT